MDLPVLFFIQAALFEGDSTLETRNNTAFYDFFIKPQQLLLQPLFVALQQVLIGQSVNLILGLATPDTFDTVAVDNLTGNLYVDRFLGSFAQTTARIFYAAPVDLDFPAGSAEFLNVTNLSYFNVNDISITAAEMTLNTSGDQYYVDVPIIAQNTGSAYALAVGDISTFLSDSTALSVTNTTASNVSLDTETNTQLLNRTQNSIGVRDFETGKGIVGIINQDFPGIFTEIRSIGMGDPEMQRDILYNAHVGGNTDVYLKTPGLLQKTVNFVGINYDFNRQFPTSIFKQITALAFTDPASALNTPFIVTNSMTVQDGIAETAASILSASVPPVVGIDLTGAEYIQLKLDNNPPIQIKVSGANVAATQRYEIINSINAALGQTVVAAVGYSFFRITSQTIGLYSSLQFTAPTGGRTDATLVLFPSLGITPYNYSVSHDEIVLGIVAQTYIENVDYAVDYTDGKIIKLLGSAILSGDTIVGPVSNGVITVGSSTLASPTPNAFSQVRVGDELNITASTGVGLGVYVVQSVVDGQHITVQEFFPTGNDSAVGFNIVSEQVLALSYLSNPLSIDIGALVLQSDGVTRGIRPGRAAYTITDAAFIGIISIQAIDPDTQVGLGTFLTPIGGYGQGGYGRGSYGSGAGGDYQLKVNVPNTRFSAFEDDTIIFNPALFGNSYAITFYYAPEILEVHAVSRSDLERVTGANILAKNFIPAFVDMTINVRTVAANVNAPADNGLAIVQNYINALVTSTSEPVDASQIEDLLLTAGIGSVQNPITMEMTVLNPDGSSTIITSPDQLLFPPVVLPSATNNFTTQRIVHFYSRNIAINVVPGVA